MAQVEADVGSRLDWVAVDHWDTDNPHTHVVLRGKDEAGRDLVIAREYIGRGMRQRASELATAWLGPRTEQEIRYDQQREIVQQRWTGLDRELQSISRGGQIDLRHDVGDAVTLRRRTLLLGRLQRLAELGIAQERTPGRWQVHHDAEQVLRALGERGDIVRTMQRAFSGQQREFTVFDASSATRPIVGRIAAKGLADELNDRAYVLIDALDGRAHYVPLPPGTDLSELPIGGIVEARAAAERAADRNVAALAENGLYRADRHLADLRAKPGISGDPAEIVAGHVRRLEALRRAGIVERLGDGIWRVPHDLVPRGGAYERERLGGANVHLHSHLPIEKQIRAIGATWLDRQLVSGANVLRKDGFAANIHDALKAREEFLEERGLVEQRGQRVIFARNLLTTLRQVNIENAAKAITIATGLEHRAVPDGGTASGVYRRSVVLASGRFAMLDDGLGFSLVPWRPVIEKHLGHALRATVRGNHVVWELGREPGRAVGSPPTSPTL